jgi:hypothetical protein
MESFGGLEKDKGMVRMHGGRPVRRKRSKDGGTVRDGEEKKEDGKDGVRRRVRKKTRGRE